MLPTTILRIQGQIDAANAFLCQAQATLTFPPPVEAAASGQVTVQ